MTRPPRTTPAAARAITLADPGWFDMDERDPRIDMPRLDEAQRRALAGDAAGMCEAACDLLTMAALEHGNVEELVHTAVVHLRRAMAGGSIHAAGLLGDLYVDSPCGCLACEVDRVEGEVLLRGAADAGNFVAMRNLALALDGGDIDRRRGDDPTALLTCAAAAGDWLAIEITNDDRGDDSDESLS